MLKANEINPKVSEQDSAGSEHDEENIHQNPDGVKILKGLTMEVYAKLSSFRFISMIECPFIIVSSEFFVKQMFHLKVSF